jgi:hypothetical protein
MHYIDKSSPKEPALYDSFAPKFWDRYTEPAEYALYAKSKALVIINKCIEIEILINFDKYLTIFT